MKRAASILGILVAAFIMGCQDSNIMEPVIAVAPEDLQLPKTQPVNTLVLNAVLREPGNILNSFVEIAGVVAYQTTVVPLDPIPPNPQYAVILNLNTDAEVRPYGASMPVTSVWRVLGTSKEWVPVPESGKAFVTKSYKIDGRSDGMLLTLTIQVTLTNVELTSMWLELPRVSVAVNND